jgi:hypothetical protein
MLRDYNFLFTPFQFTPTSLGTHLGLETTFRSFYAFWRNGVFLLVQDIAFGCVYFES